MTCGKRLRGRIRERGSGIEKEIGRSREGKKRMGWNERDRGKFRENRES